MPLAKFIAALGVCAMLGLILYGFSVGDFAADGAVLAANPWGQVSLVDLYTGFIVFSMWLAYREPTMLKRIVWIIGMMTLGNLIAALYVFLALHHSGGDWRKVFMGHRA